MRRRGIGVERATTYGIDGRERRLLDGNRREDSKHAVAQRELGAKPEPNERDVGCDGVRGYDDVARASAREEVEQPFAARVDGDARVRTKQLLVGRTTRHRDGKRHRRLDAFASKDAHAVVRSNRSDVVGKRAIDRGIERRVDPLHSAT